MRMVAQGGAQFQTGTTAAQIIQTSTGQTIQMISQDGTPIQMVQQANGKFIATQGNNNSMNFVTLQVRKIFKSLCFMSTKRPYQFTSGRISGKFFGPITGQLFTLKF